MAQDPYLPLFKSFRNAVIAASGGSSLTGIRDPDYPMDEYYYFEDRLSVMRQIQSADLDLDFPPSWMPQLLESLAARMSLSAPMLIPHLSKLSGNSYKELFESALDIVGLGRNAADAEWVGFNDNWTIEFFPTLARAFPDARFIVVVRDPRSSIASQARMEDPSRVALTMSFARCWRKNIAFASHFQQSELFRDRLHIVSYEQIVREPQRTTEDLCQFLEVDYLPEMIDTTRFVGPQGTAWVPNSNFNVPRQGIYPDSLERWKTSLPPEVIRIIEFVTGPDLKMAGYPLTTKGDSENPGWDVYNRHAEENEICLGWRTDNHNPEMDFALELLRRYCLRDDTEDIGLIEKCFLFPEAYTALCKGQPLFSGGVHAAQGFD